MSDVIATPVVAEVAPVVVPVVKAPKTYTCTKCGVQFAGSGKRGRPSKLCPNCRPVKE